MSPSSSPKLPHEILVHLIDTLGVSIDVDPVACQALATCSLVCRSFQARAYQYLFSRLTLNFVNGGPPRLSRFCATLQTLDEARSDTRPTSLTRELRSLELVALYERDSQDRADPIWAEVMSKVLDKIGTRLEEFGMQALVHVSIQWGVLSPVFNRAFYALLHSPSLRTLRLVGFTHIPPSIIYRASGIKSIDLRLSVALDASSDPEPDLQDLRLSSSAFIQPERICTDSLKSIMHMMKPRFPSAMGAEARPARRLANLKTMVAFALTTVEQVNTFAQILLFARNSLEDMHLILEHQFTGLPTFPITSFPNLRVFRITHREAFATSLTTERTPPELLRSVLDVTVDSNIPFPPHLSVLEIGLDVWFLQSKLRPFAGNETEWVRLALLLTHEKYRNVKVVQIVLTLRGEEDARRIVHLEANRRIIQDMTEVFNSRVVGTNRRLVVVARHLLNDW